MSEFLAQNAARGAASTARSRLYGIWASMLQRCYNPRHAAYKYYGARRITVCKRWKTFANFRADLGERPAGMTLDRIDNFGGYKPANCRWATHLQQALNKRSTCLITFSRRTQAMSCWARDLGIGYSTLRRRVVRLGGRRAIEVSLFHRPGPKPIRPPKAGKKTKR